MASRNRKGSRKGGDGNGKQHGAQHGDKDRGEEGELISDPRFSQIHFNPMFKKVGRKRNTVRVDGRFKRMFTDKAFHATTSTDARGRPVKTTAVENLKKFYHLDSDEEEAEGESEGESGGESDDGSENEEGGSAVGDVARDSSVLEGDQRFAVDYSRGEVLLSSSSEEEEESEEEDEDVELEEDTAAVWDNFKDEKVPMRDDATRRLAICNMDWDHVTAQDLFVLCNSFKPQAGAIHSVTIYPSEFGLERMRLEETAGPAAFAASDAATQAEDEAEDDSLDQDKLREYQMSRLKYFYSVVDCDSPETANAVYESCDGLEYEDTANFMDCRFVPDEMVFEQQPREAATDLPAEGSFDPVQFTTNALKQSKVTLTWDEPDERRSRVLRRKFTDKDLELMDFEDYVASSESDSDDSDTGAQPDKFKALVDELKRKREEEEEESDKELEVTWDVGLKSKAESLVKERAERLEEARMTVGEKLERKRKAKKRERKQKLKAAAKSQGAVSEEAKALQELKELADQDPFFRDEYQQMKADYDAKQEVAGGQGGDEAHSEAGLDLDQLAVLGAQSDKHFNMQKILKAEKNNSRKRKRKSKHQDEQATETQDTFELDVADGRFHALFDSEHFAIDPNDSKFMPTKAMKALLATKRSRPAQQAAAVQASDEEDGERKRPRKKEAEADPTEIEPAPPNRSVKDMVASIKQKTAARAKTRRGAKGKGKR